MVKGPMAVHVVASGPGRLGGGDAVVPMSILRRRGGGVKSDLRLPIGESGALSAFIGVHRRFLLIPCSEELRTG